MAHTIPILTRAGQTKGEVTLPAGLFGIEPNEHVMYEAVRTYLANQRAGTVSKKTRAEVAGGGRKPWRQKHTGRARAGSNTVPHWVGGGLAFAPKPRDHRMKLPKKVKRLALRSALSSKAAAGEIRATEDIELAKVSTKDVAAILKAADAGAGKVLLVVRAADERLLMSARNIAKLIVLEAKELTTYHLLWADRVVLTEGALKAVEEVFGE
ncbi:MAG: 50S ribosomal protein L4 [Candidatus Eisenbacteria bacterium]|nr:50S ribosomal protein L4 [Candidatus Eisenbacteria bacterium]